MHGRSPVQYTDIAVQGEFFSDIAGLLPDIDVPLASQCQNPKDRKLVSKNRPKMASKTPIP